jgi:hypothetical protein
MNKKELIKKITEKKEFSQLPEKDVEKALLQFDKPKYIDIEKIKLTRDLLRKVFTVFLSKNLLKNKDYEPDFILKKHISTKERFDFYKDIYSRLFKKENSGKEINIFDLGSGINGFSYKYFNKKIDYTGIESVGQLVFLTNKYFKKNNYEKNSRTIHLSLFDLEKIKKIINKKKGMKIVFLFKVIDSLEALERDYSKKLLLELSSSVDKFLISFATRSLIKKKRFFVNRNWILNFIKDNFDITDNFEFGGEKYIFFKSR